MVTRRQCVQSNLLSEARVFRDANIVDVHSYEELKAVVAEGVSHNNQG